MDLPSRRKWCAPPTKDRDTAARHQRPGGDCPAHARPSAPRRRGRRPGPPACRLVVRAEGGRQRGAPAGRRRPDAARPSSEEERRSTPGPLPRCRGGPAGPRSLRRPFLPGRAGSPREHGESARRRCPRPGRHRPRRGAGRDGAPGRRHRGTRRWPGREAQDGRRRIARAPLSAIRRRRSPRLGGRGDPRPGGIGPAAQGGRLGWPHRRVPGGQGSARHDRGRRPRHGGPQETQGGPLRLAAGRHRRGAHRPASRRSSAGDSERAAGGRGCARPSRHHRGRIGAGRDPRATRSRRAAAARDELLDACPLAAWRSEIDGGGAGRPSVAGSGEADRCRHAAGRRRIDGRRQSAGRSTT